MKTTLNKIRENSPCASGWKKLLATLGKTKADDEPLSIITILDSNGFDDALWCLRSVENEDKKIRLFAVWCARQVQHLMKDERSIKALGVSEAFANGNATQEELDDAYNAAKAAAWDVARPAFWDAARVAAKAAAGADARDAAWDAYNAVSFVNAAGNAQEIELRRLCDGQS